MITFKSFLNFRPADLKVEAGAEDGIREAAEAELAEANHLVPVDTGALRASGGVSTDGLVGAVTYTADYAVYVHERLDVYHPDGQPKFLENAQDAMRSRAAAILAASIRRRT